jgi:alpha-beta hydrolase superfamily lysophospholipase
VPKVRAWFEGQESEDKRYVLYPEFDHLLDFEDERGRYWDDLVDWLNEHAPARTREGATA